MHFYYLLSQVCKLLRHISPTDSLHVQAKYGDINLKIYGPQIIVAARTLCSNPTSKIAKENLEVFIDMWQSLMDDVATLATDIAEICRRRAISKPVYMSLPRPGVSQDVLSAIYLNYNRLLRRIIFSQNNYFYYHIYSTRKVFA